MVMDGEDLSAPWSKALRIGCMPFLISLGAFGCFIMLGANLPWFVALPILCLQTAIGVWTGLSYRGLADSAKVRSSGLEIQSGSKVHFVEWSSIAVVEASRWRKDRLVTLHARQPGHELGKFCIVPKISGVIWPRQASPLAGQIAKMCPGAHRIGFK